jgi:FixJ family two-component response regulator
MISMRRNERQAGAEPGPAVLIVEDDPLLREALARLCRTVGLQSETFSSAAELLGAKLPAVPSCLLLDIRLPGISGLDLQTRLTATGIHLPIVFMTGHGDIPMSVGAMKAGAVDFLTKPFREQDLLDAVGRGIDRDRERRQREEGEAALRQRLATLSPREREVLALVTAGLINKQVAARMGISEITVKIHRGHVMRKMGARSLADLVRMAESLGVSSL